MAEVALAVVPIFFSACQGFGILLDKIHLFRHYKKEIHWLRLKVSVQSKCYKDEIRRLVIATLDTHKAQSLLADDNHSEWKDPELETIFKQYMGKLFPDFVSAVQLIHEALASIQDKLDALAPPDVKSPRFKAIREQFKLAFKRDRYKEDIDILKETVAELKTIRKLAAAVPEEHTKRDRYAAKQQRPRNTPAPDMVTHLETVQQYNAIRSLSCSFQHFLRNQWSCCCPSHSQHNGRLFLTSFSPKQLSLNWLLETAGKEGHTTRISNRFIFQVWSQPPGPLTPNSDTTPESPRLPKRQRLSPQPSTLPGAFSQTQGPPRQLAATQSAVASLCQELEAISLHSQPYKSSLGHFDSRTQYSYRFEPQQSSFALPKKPEGAPISSLRSTIATWDLHEITHHPLSHLLTYRPEYVITRRERIQLAAMLVRVTLMAHSTAGWPGNQSASIDCILEGIYFLMQGSVADTSTGFTIQSLLDTLHIPVKIGNSSQSSNNAGSDTNMTDAEESIPLRNARSATVETPDSMDPMEEELKDTFGVRNLVLYRLGVALLSIARWEKIQWQDIRSVRKKVAALDWGGATFKTAVKKLIDCDFGAGDHLGKEKLQLEFEVMRGVVGPLEKSVDVISQSINGADVLSSRNLDKLGGSWLEEPGRWVAQVQYETYPSQVAMGEGSSWAWPPGPLD